MSIEKDYEMLKEELLFEADRNHVDQDYADGVYKGYTIVKKYLEKYFAAEREQFDRSVFQ
jgi:hypothetical protein